MEVVQILEVVGGNSEDAQEGNMEENFEDLILTVVPEGQENGASIDSNEIDGVPRTILVTEVRHQESLVEKDKEIESLRGRVDELENQVHFLEDELRLIRRKVQGTNINTYGIVRKTVLEILNKQTLKISLSDFEDEMEPPEVEAKGRSSLGRLRKKIENGLSEDDEEDMDFSDEEEPTTRKRRRPGRPKGRGSTAKRARVHRIELTPPPPKVSRPRGRPGRPAKKTEDNEDGTAIIPPLLDQNEREEYSNALALKEDRSQEEFDVVGAGEEGADAGECAVAPEEITAENNVTTDGEEASAEHDVKYVDVEDMNEGEQTLSTEEEKETILPTLVSDSKMSPKKGKRRGGSETEKEAEPIPIRTSNRMRKISTKRNE